MVDVEIPRVALALEQDRNALATAARKGDVVRIRRGAYCAPDDLRVDGAARGALEDRNRALARLRALDSQIRAEHVFSHVSAALLHGLRVWRNPRETHVYQRYRASGHAAADVRRHSWTLAPDDVTEAAGLPVTTRERTVVDCVRTMHPLEGLVIADSALAAGAEPDALLDVLEAGAGHRGARRARLVIELADGGAQSAWETWTRYELLRVGLPRPTTQLPVETDRGLFHTDLGYEQWALGIEFDGQVKYRPDGVRPGHDPAQEYLREKARAEAIRRAGVTIEHVTAADKRDVPALVARLTGHLPAEVVRAARPDPRLPPT
jgi:predicted transcriptional regulator of viral defense system